MVNVEADATVGTELAKEARRRGCVYSLADGDQPSLIVGLADWSAALGFQVEVAGKWTDVYSADEAEARLRESARPSDVTFLDGSKTEIELAAAANALGLTVPDDGLYGFGLDLAQIPESFRRNSREPHAPRVEYIDCRKLNPDSDTFYGGGVFVSVSGGVREAMEIMAKKGVTVSQDRSHAAFFRPYHLVGAETPWTILRAALENEPTAQPLEERWVEVVAETKKELSAGQRLTGLGSFDVAGRAVSAAEARRNGLLPVGMAAGCRLRVPYRPGQRIRVQDVDPPKDSVLWELRPLTELT
jgi:predicted homoserine dehydrogenase-like protein